jgi:hypothetical protein
MRSNGKTATPFAAAAGSRAEPCTAHGGPIMNILRSRPAALVYLSMLALLAALPARFRGWFATYGLVHECAHIAVFYLAFLVTSLRAKNGRDAAFLGCLLLSYGAALEALQTVLFHIPLEYSDVLADAAGVALGVLSKSVGASYKTNQS